MWSLWLIASSPLWSERALVHTCAYVHACTANVQCAACVRLHTSMSVLNTQRSSPYFQKSFLVYLKEVQMVFKEQNAWGKSGLGCGTSLPILTHYCSRVCVYVCVPFTCMWLAFPWLVQSAINLWTHQWTLCSFSFFCTFIHLSWYWVFCVNPP